jgi:hypothetical protein
MIMQANTPKSLSAAGWLLLGLAAFALPVAARAQVPARQGDDREQEIKVLKEKLRALEAAGREQQAFLESAIVLVDAQDADAEKQMKLAADLKAQIAKKRAELQDLEAKLKAVVAGFDAKKAGKIKIDGKGKADIEAILLEKGAKARIIEQEKAHAEAAMKKAVEQVQKQLKGLNIDVKVEDVLKQAGVADKIKIKSKDGKDMELILDNIKLEGGKGDLILKMLDAKDLEKLKKLEELKHLDGKKLEGALKGVIQLNPDNKKPIVDLIVEGADSKSQSIEARLERLMKELQELQKEVKASKKKRVD